MAASDVTWTAVKTALDAASTALVSDNYTECRKQLTKARILRAGVEDQAQASGTAALLDRQYQSILDMVDRLEAEANQDDDNQRRTIFGRTNFH